MKVVQINVTYGDSDSTGRNVKELHNFLENQGIDSYVYAAVNNDNSKEVQKVCFFSRPADRKIHAILSRITGLQGYFSLFSTRKLMKRIENVSPDVVVLHNLHGNYINLPFLLRGLGKKKYPVVLVLHDCWFFTGHCCHYITDECYKWKESCGRCPAKRKWNPSWFFDTSSFVLRRKKRMYRNIDDLTVVGVSDWITKEAKQSILSPAKRIMRIYNWVDVDVFKPVSCEGIKNRMGITNESKVILGVSSAWNSNKGLDEFEILAKEIPDATVILVGNKPSREMPKNVYFTGVIRDPRILAECYSMASVFVNPSKQETFGKTTAEALCCGTPAIVYDTTACPELIGDGCGRVVPAFETEKLVDAVKDLLKEDKTKLSGYCRKFGADTFGKIHSLNEYKNLLCLVSEGR